MEITVQEQFLFKLTKGTFWLLVSDSNICQFGQNKLQQFFDLIRQKFMLPQYNAKKYPHFSIFAFGVIHTPRGQDFDPI